MFERPLLWPVRTFLICFCSKVKSSVKNLQITNTATKTPLNHEWDGKKSVKVVCYFSQCYNRTFQLFIMRCCSVRSYRRKAGFWCHPWMIHLNNTTSSLAPDFSWQWGLRGAKNSHPGTKAWGNWLDAARDKALAWTCMDLTQTRSELINPDQNNRLCVLITIIHPPSLHPSRIFHVRVKKFCHIRVSTAV